MLTHLIEYVLAAGVLLPFLASAIFFVQISACLCLPRARALPLANCDHPTAILVPAHNEAAGITDLVHHLLPQLCESGTLLVIADNCTDETARLAAVAGAQVLVRADPARRGKGYALAAGLERLAANPPKIVVFLDADTRLSDGGVRILSRASMAAQCPVQCLNLMLQPPGQGNASRLGEFAWRIRNDLRPAGLARLGGPCQLLGTGMAMPWQLARQLPFATGHVTEDLLTGLECAQLGRAPRFLDTVCVTSYFPQTHAGCASQKQRWIHGQLALMSARAPQLVWRGLRRGDSALLALALDLMVPPLGLLAFADMLSLLAGLGFAALTGGELPLLLASAAMALFCLAVLGAWHLRGRNLIGPRELRGMAAHFWSVLHIGGLFMRGKRSSWVRADRSA